MENPDQAQAPFYRFQAVGRNPGALLFYNSVNGTGATALLDSGGNYQYVSFLSGFGYWTHVVATAGGGILFYNASTGMGATAFLGAPSMGAI